MNRREMLTLGLRKAVQTLTAVLGTVGGLGVAASAGDVAPETKPSCFPAKRPEPESSDTGSSRGKEQ